MNLTQEQKLILLSIYGKSQDAQKESSSLQNRIEDIDDEVFSNWYVLYIKDLEKRDLRNKITEQAGDSTSLLGTTADGVQLLLYAFSKHMIALNNAQSLADVRASADEFVALSASFLSKVDSGEVRLPFLVKGLDSVVGDIEDRATKVADVLAQATSENKETD